MSVETKPADEQPAPAMDLEGLKRLNGLRQKSRQGNVPKPAVQPPQPPEPKLQAALTIREYLDSCPIKAFHEQILESCRKYGISLDSLWPPKFPEEGGRELESLPVSTAKIIQLDFWEDDKCAAPNIVFRSALFPALNPKQERCYLDQERIFTTKGGEIYFAGKQ